METLWDSSPQIMVPEAEYIRLLGFPSDYKLTGRSMELASQTRQWYAENGRPWIYAKLFNGLKLKDTFRFEIDGAIFNSKSVSTSLRNAEATQAIVVAVSAGIECEEKAKDCWLQGKPDEYYFLEMYGSAVVENLIRNTFARYCAWADRKGLAILPHYSPGYPEWDISEQTRLMELIKEGENVPFPGPLEVIHSGMLNPKKSLLAVLGVTNNLEKVTSTPSFVPCENCSLEGCQYRRVPYTRAIKPMENLAGIKSNMIRILNQSENKKSLELDRSKNYFLNEKVLKKWSYERLSMFELNDGGVEAIFRYDGTTCKNLGRSLRFDYKVTLGNRESFFKIKNAFCVPSEDDTGHKYMCEYVKRPNQLMSEVKNELPLIGQSINEVLTWDRDYDPEACYCSMTSRLHKWGLVLEVIHYSLLQNGLKP